MARTSHVAGRGATAVVALFLALLAVTRGALAIEYRLQVVSVHEHSFAALLRRGEFTYGASGPGLDRLEASLDRDEFPQGAILYDRPVDAVNAVVARAYGAVPVRAELSNDSDHRRWREFRWEGRPGEQTVWKVSPSRLRTVELDRVALKGQGPLRQFLPFTPAPHARRGEALRVPLEFLSAQEARGTAWSE